MTMSMRRDSGPTDHPVLFDLPELPKRVKSKWDQARELWSVQEREGLIPLTFAAELLEIHRSRVHQLVEAGKLTRYSLCGSKFLSVRQLREFVDVERPTGRPTKKVA